jgi:hypothetical protein
MSRGGGTDGGRWEVSSSRGWGEPDSTQGERIWSSLVRQKVERGLLLLIPILCIRAFKRINKSGNREPRRATGCELRFLGFNMRDEEMKGSLCRS